jgi:hypothetical protein
MLIIKNMGEKWAFLLKSLQIYAKKLKKTQIFLSPKFGEKLPK